MFHGIIKRRKKDWDYAEKYTANPIKSLYLQADIAQQFLNTIRVTLKKCFVLADYPHCGDIWILFPTYDDEAVTVGYVNEDDNSYLLDSDFIYKRFLKLRPENSILLNKQTYYSELFRIGVLKPYKLFQHKPLYRLRLERDSYRQYFCISGGLVDFDISTLRWL